MARNEAAVVAALLRSDFHSFLRKCFETLHPGTQFQDNWHLRVLAGELERVGRGEGTRLMVNLPPRSLKSIATSVAFVAWHLGHHPSAAVICASYGADLAEKLAFDCRKIMTSRWYEATFATRVDRRKSAVGDFYTVQGGARLATSVGGALTGRGGDLIVIDDPAKPDEMLSDVQRDAVNRWFKSTLYSRLNDKAKAAIVIAMQRLHVDDLTGHLLRDGGDAWRHLLLAAAAETDETYVVETLKGPRTFGRKAGELLHPAREPAEALAQIRVTLGNYYYSAQYQQQPMVPDGNLVKLSWFPRYQERPAAFDQVFQSWDTASKAGELNSHNVCTTWGIKGDAIYLLDVYRKQVEYPDLKRAVLMQATLHKPRVILVEDKSSGIALLQELKREGLHNLTAVKPDKEKIMRLSAQTGVMEAGRVYLPKAAAWLAAYEAELMLFPAGSHDDQVDSSTQALAYWQTVLQEPAMLIFMRMECERLGLIPPRQSPPHRLADHEHEPPTPPP